MGVQESKQHNMVRLNDEQLASKINFIENYFNASNAADGSTFDPNSNVTNKNIATMVAELNKDINIQVKRQLVYNSIKKHFNIKIANEYIRQLEEHEIYAHDETFLAPYTYSAKEVVVVVKNGEYLLISFEDLYNLYEGEGILEDEKKGVWCKYPNDLYIFDKDKLTKVTRLTKKIRHRNLVRVKTSFGEDIVVTDNHPMIVNEDINNTVEAKNCVNLQQYRPNYQIPFNGISTLQLNELSPYLKEQFSTHFIGQIEKRHKHYICKNILKLNEEFGYVVGFFIGDGNYNIVNDEYEAVLHFTQKDRAVLEKIADICVRYVNAIPIISYKEGKNNCWILDIFSPELVWIFKNIFNIKHLAQNKTLPINIFNYTKEFATGIIEGLIDSDGNVNKDVIQIRLASRTAIQQISVLIRQLGFTGGNQVQNLPFSNNTEIKTNYTIWGVTFNKTESSPLLSLSTKAKDIQPVKKYIKYKKGWATITKVEKIKESSFLDSNNYIYDITTESHTFICNDLLVHNCAAVSLYPFIQNGLQDFGGDSKAPKHLSSFNGGFVNLIFALSSQFCGAIATVEYLMCFDYYARLDYGDNYLETHESIIKQELQQVVYALNQPASARNFQSVFWNISIFDKYYFEGLFKHFVFPDGSKPNWETVNKLQKFFMHWFNAERYKALLTFPVVTVCLLNDGNYAKDKEYTDLVTNELSNGNSFFIYTSDSVDSLSSCCRLRNSITDQLNDFSYSLGAGGVMTGSINVITLNMNRFFQKYYNRLTRYGRKDYLIRQINLIHKYQVATRKLFEELQQKGMLPAYTANFISFDKQYLTIGINGLLEAAEYLNLTPKSDNIRYKSFISSILKTIADKNKEASKKYGMKFNTELVPAENLGVKFAKWDKKDSLFVPRDCYNSYLYPVEDNSIDFMDRIILHGKETTQFLDGGSAVHLNLEEIPSKKVAEAILETAIKCGCNYFCTNVKITICNDCNYIDKNTLTKCSKCGSKNIDYATRVIGYLRRISNFSKERQEEESRRYYHKC